MSVSSQSSVDGLAAVIEAQRSFITSTDPVQALSTVLGKIVELSDSQLGFLGQVSRAGGDGQVPEIREITRVVLTAAHQASNGNRSPVEMQLADLKRFLGTLLTTREAAIANSSTKSVKSRLAQALQPQRAMLGLPIFQAGDELVGVVGLSSQQAGYDNELIARLQPLCDALGAMLPAAQRELDRRAAEDSLRASEARYRSYVEHATDGIFLYDRSGRIVDVNRQGSASLGFERDELIGKMPEEFESATSSESVTELAWRLDAGETVSFNSHHRRKDGSTFPVEVRVRPFWVNGVRHGLAIVRDISERKLTAKKLSESEERLRLALAASQTGVWEWNTETNTVFWSPECYDIFRMPAFDGRAESFRKHVHPDDLAALGNIVEQTIQKDAINSWEFRIITPEGQVRWISNCGLVRRDESTKAIKLIGTACDITDTKLAAEAIQKQYAILQTILDSTTDCIYMKDIQGRYVMANAASTAIIDRPVEQIIGRDDTELFPVEAARSIRAHDRKLLNDGVEQRYKETINLGDRTLHFSTSKNICRDSAGNVIGMVGITRDETAQVEAEDALRQSQVLLENIVEHIPLAVFVKDPKDDFRVRLWNKAAETIFGISSDEMIGSNAYDFWPKEQADFYTSIDEKVMIDGVHCEIDEESHTTRTGEPIIVHTHKMPLADRAGKPSLLLAICEDITARKRSEEALREAQRRLEFTLKGADLGLWDWDLRTNEVNFSNEWKSQLGYRPDEVSNSYFEWESRVHPDDLEQAHANVQNAVEKRTPEYRSEFRMRHKDGTWRWILSRGAVTDDEHGKPARMLGVHIDISERKHAEEALQASESRYRTFVDHATDALFLQDSSGCVLDVNQQACVSLGYEREELIGMFPWQFDPDVTEKFTDSVLQRLASGETVAFDSRHQRQDGSSFPVEVRLRPFWIGENRFHVGLVRDITERKRAEQALRDSEARLRTLLENLDMVAVQAYEPDGTITFWNKASELFYGYSAADALGRDVVDLLHGEATRDEERRIMAESLRTGKTPAADEIEIIRRDGSKMTVFASRIIHSRPGKSPEFFCFDVDVTERKRAKEELEFRQAELLHASRLTTVGQMVAELSHEVAQPLSAISNFAAACDAILAASSEFDAKTLHDYIHAIIKQNERCMAILKRLRDFSRRTATSRAWCSIGELLRDSVELIGNELRRSQVSVQFQLVDNLPLVWADRIQLQQVVVNLLTNARDAVRDQEPERRVIILRASADDKELSFEVDDLGCGISAEIATHLFDPFFTTKEHGMGIGLSICQSIVKDHGGRIEAGSNELGGAMLCVWLPLKGKE